MFIELDREIFSYCESQKLTYRQENAVKNILNSHFEGKHFVYFENYIPSMKNLNHFGSIELFKLQKIYTDSLQSIGIKQELRKILKVGLSPCYDNSERNINNQIVKLIHLDEFYDSSSTQKSVILAEDDSDSQIFQLFAKSLANRSRGIKLEFECQGGGGSSVADRLSGLVKARRIALCIVDSDRLAPGSTLGETAKNAMKVPLTHFQELAILECRNIENFIFWFIPRLPATQSSLPSIYKFSHKLVPGILDKPFWMYAPLRDGLNCCKIEHIKSKSRENYDFTYSCLNSYFPETIKILAIPPPRCPPSTCNYQILQPLGRFAETWLGLVNENMINTIMSTEDTPEFIVNLSNTILSYGFSAQPCYTI